MDEREELLRAADSFDDVLVDAYGLCRWTDVAEALQIMRRKLADYTRAPAQSRQEPGTFDCPCGCGRKVISATGEAALRAPEAADAGAIRSKITDILQSEISTPGEDYVDLGDAVDLLADLYASPASPAADAGMRERAALEGLVSACNRYDEEPDSSMAAAGYYSAMEAAREALAHPSTVRDTATDSPSNDPDMPNLRLCSFNYLADEMRRRGATVTPAPHGGDFCNG